MQRKILGGIHTSKRTDLILVVTVLLLLVSGDVTSFLDEEKKPSYYRAAIGETVSFNCHIEFPHDVPIPYILNWNKEGQTIFSSYESNLSAKGSYKGRIKLLPANSGLGKGSINLTNIRETDKGWYECQVMFPNRSPTRHQNGTWFHLTVEGGNVIAIPPINQTTIEGEPARFPCSAKENSSIVIWKKDGVRLSNRNHNFPVRYVLDSEGTLTISPTMMDDLGEFTCEATNSKGEKQSAKAFLNVQYKAKVIEAPKEIYLPYGRPAVIDCHFRSNPPLMKLRWEKDGFLFDPYNVQGVFYRSNGSLFFDKVKEEHSGEYTCTPFNELGTEGPSPKMSIIVLKPPVFTLIPHMLYIRRKGDTIEIPCDAEEEHGVHKPNITWIKDGLPLPKDKLKLIGGNLSLSNLHEDDRGIYQCIASNAVTSIFTETELMIENTAPRAPYNVEAESTDRSVTIKWKSGLTKPKLNFSIWYRIVDSSTWKFVPVLPNDVKELTIPDALPGTEYEIMVLSQDMYGDGMFSKSIRVKTKGEMDYVALEQQLQGNSRQDAKTAIGSPRNLNVQITSEGCMITWEPPDVGSHNLEHYKVQWSQNEETFNGVTEDTFYLIKNSDGGGAFKFEVFAVAKDKTQSESSTFVIHIPSDQRIKAITLGVSLGFVLLVATVLLTWIIHKHLTQKS